MKIRKPYSKLAVQVFPLKEDSKIRPAEGSQFDIPNVEALDLVFKVPVVYKHSAHRDFIPLARFYLQRERSETSLPISPKKIPEKWGLGGRTPHFSEFF